MKRYMKWFSVVLAVVLVITMIFPATADNINAFNLKEKAKAAQIAKERAEALENSKKLENIEVRIAAKAGGNGRLFGAITSKEIVDALAAQHGIIIEKNKVVQSEPIKTFGKFDVKCKFGYEISGILHLVVEEA